MGIRLSQLKQSEVFMGQVKLKDNVDEMLTQISNKRKSAGELVNQKQSIVEQLIMKQFKREIK